MVKIRNFEKKDTEVTWEIKFNTIRTVNICNYTEAQTRAWAPDNFDMDIWQERVCKMNPFIAELNGQVVGFADLQIDGYIDHFFCHSNYQGLGVGRALMEHILLSGSLTGVKRFYSEVSLTARQFYEHFGFTVVKESQLELKGQKLTNFVMEKFN